MNLLSNMDNTNNIEQSNMDTNISVLEGNSNNIDVENKYFTFIYINRKIPTDSQIKTFVNLNFKDDLSKITNESEKQILICKLSFYIRHLINSSLFHITSNPQHSRYIHRPYLYIVEISKNDNIEFDNKSDLSDYTCINTFEQNNNYTTSSKSSNFCTYNNEQFNKKYVFSDLKCYKFDYLIIDFHSLNYNFFYNIRMINNHLRSLHNQIVSTNTIETDEPNVKYYNMISVSSIFKYIMDNYYPKKIKCTDSSEEEDNIIYYIFQLCAILKNNYKELPHNINYDYIYNLYNGNVNINKINLELTPIILNYSKIIFNHFKNNYNILPNNIEDILTCNSFRKCNNVKLKKILHNKFTLEILDSNLRLSFIKNETYYDVSVISFSKIILTNCNYNDIKNKDLVPIDVLLKNKIKLKDTIHSKTLFSITFSNDLYNNGANTYLSPYSGINIIHNYNYIAWILSFMKKTNKIKINYSVNIKNNDTYIKINIYFKNDYLDKFINNISNFDITSLLLFKNKQYHKWNLDTFKSWNKNKFTIESKAIENNSKLNIDDIKLNLFNYQIENVKWLDQIESKIRSNKITCKSFVEPNQYFYNLYIKNILRYNDCLKHTINILKQDYVCLFETKVNGKLIDNTRQYIDLYNGKNIEKTNVKIIKLSDYKSQCNLSINFNGVILTDEVGLGKTLSIVSHLVNQKINDNKYKSSYQLNNLIILPPRLLVQWEYEIEQYLKDKTILTVKKISTLTDIKKLSKSKTTYDIYLISYNLLINDKYYQLITELGSKIFNIFEIKWNRIIVDEIHELLKPMITINGDIPRLNRHYLKKNERKMVDVFLKNFKTNYKIGLSATPFEYGVQNLFGIVKFLSSSTVNSDNYYDIIGIKGININKIINTLFRGTTKKQVSSEIDIPIFTEKIIWVEQSNIERNIYNSYKQRYNRTVNYIKNLYLICTNISIAECFEDTFINSTNELLTLKQLNDNMIKMFKQSLDTAEKKLHSINSKFKKDNKKFDILKTVFDYLNNNCISPSDDVKKMIKDLIHKYVNSNKYEYSYSKHYKNNIIIKNSKFIADSFIDQYTIYDEAEIINQINEFISNLFNLIYIEITNILNSALSENNPNFIDYKKEEDNYKFTNRYFELTDTNKKYYIKKIISLLKTEYLTKIKKNNSDIEKINNDINRFKNQIKLFEDNSFIKDKTDDPCLICFDEFKQVVVTKCRHIFCGDCYNILSKNGKTNIKCPECRTDISPYQVNITTMDNIKESLEEKEDVNTEIKEENQQDNDLSLTTEEEASVHKEMILKFKQQNWQDECIDKYGAKMTKLIKYLYDLIIESDENRIIMFSQYDKMLKLIGKTLSEYHIKHVFCEGNVHCVSKNIDNFKRDKSIKIILLSSEKCNSGNNLTEANHIILVDVLNSNGETTKAIESQAIGRAVRLGQKKPVLVTRFITKNTIEEETYKKNKYDITQLQ